MFGPQKTELSVCGVGVAGMGSSLLRASDCPSNSGSLGPTHGHCTNGETEAQRNQDPPGWSARAAELSGLPLGRCFPSFKAWGCASGKQATSCWWQSSPAGKSSLESDFHPRLQERGMAHKFLSFSRVLVAASCRL